jgi:hypothetical protein
MEHPPLAAKGNLGIIQMVATATSEAGKGRAENSLGALVERATKRFLVGVAHIFEVHGLV